MTKILTKLLCLGLLAVSCSLTAQTTNLDALVGFCPTTSGVATATGAVTDAEFMAALGTPPANGATYQLGCDVAVESVTFELGHSWSGDLDGDGIELIAPSGDAITLFVDAGNGNNDIGTCPGNSCTCSLEPFVFTDGDMSTGIGWNGSDPFTFTVAGLTDFAAGNDAAGDWVIQLTDDVGGDGPQMANAQIVFAAAPPAIDVVCPNDTTIVLADGDCLPSQTIDFDIDIVSPPVDLNVTAGVSDVFNFTQGIFMTCPADIAIGVGEVVITSVNTSNFFTGGPFPCDRDNCEDANDLDNVQTRQIFTIPAGFDQVSFDWSTVNEDCFGFGFDIFGVQVFENGVGFTTNIGLTAGTANGTFVVNAPAGGFVLFVTQSVDVSDGSIIATINNIQTQNDPAGPGFEFEADSDLADVTIDYIGNSVTYDLDFGVNNNSYTIFDECGDITCEWAVTVDDSNIKRELACNGQVNVSYDDNCSAFITADMVLEGSPYMCDDYYEVTLTDENGNVLPNPISGVLGDVTVSVMDPLTGVSCWGTILFEDSTFPTQADVDAVCNPDGGTITCDQVEDYLDGENQTLGRPGGFTVGCSTYGWSLYDIDYTSGNNGCEYVITRTFRTSWTDKNGVEGEAFCARTFTSIPFNGVVSTPQGVVTLPCGSDLSPEGIVAIGTSNGGGQLRAYPKIGATYLEPGVEVCGVRATYTDLELDACAPGCSGTRKVIRTWRILDWCEATDGDADNGVSEFIQVLKAIDEEAPTFLISDITVGTNPWNCTANFEIPAVWELHDNCDANPTYVGTTGPVPVDGRTVLGAPIGVHNFDVTYTDCCGNLGTRTVQVTVIDNVGPVVSTVQDVVVSLTPGGPNPEDASAKLFWYHLDNQSYDACTDVTVEIRRPSTDPACNNIGANGYNNNVTFNNNGDSDDNTRDTDGGQFVKFCCADLEAATVDVNGDGELDAGYVEVIVRAYDANGNYNEAWSFVKVEDNTPPIISGPTDATIYCDWPIEDNFDTRTYTSRGAAAGSNRYETADGVDFTKTGEATGYSTCGPVSVDYVDVIIVTEGDGIDQCGAGQFTRIFRVQKTDKNGNVQSAYAFQKITILGRDGDADVTQDINTPAGVGPEDFGPFVISSCDGPTAADLDEYSPIVVGDDPCDVIGRAIEIDTFFFEQGACKKWVVEYKFVNWCDDEEWNDFEPVTFMYIDTEAPVLTGCQDTMYAQNDAANCQHALQLENTATDNGGCAGEANAWLKWQVYIDLWGDGTIDAYGTSYAFNNRNSWAKSNSNNPFLPSNPNWSDDVYVVNIAPTGSGEATSLPALPADLLQGNMSNHKVTWKVTDGCHNHESCSEDIMVVDKKAPTPYCRNLSTAVMDGSDMVELWAVDFDVDSEDNCTAKEDLLFTFNGEHPVLDQIADEHYFTGAGESATEAMYLAGEAQRWLPSSRSSAMVFGCDDVPGVTIQMSVWDEKLNTDYCEVNLTIVDSDGSCGGGSRAVSGTVATSTGSVIANVETTIESILPEYPKSNMTDAAGTYTFYSNPENVDYTVSVEKNTGLLDGVNTLDLVKIQRHLLGLELLDNPYKVIAADIDNNESIQPGDLLTLRKAILGLTDEFTNNTSWRFVDGSQSNDDLSLVNDYISTGMLSSDMMDENFVAVKVGDVDGTVDGLLANGGLQTRSGNAITLVAQDQTLEAGELVEVTFTSSELSEVYGYQFTMDLTGLEFAGVRAGAANMTEANVGVLNSVVTVSYNDVTALNAGSAEGLFTMSFVATEAGQLSDMMKSTSSVTRAEAYVGESLETVGVEIAMRGANATAQFELLQNEPNPFKASTTIGFTLPAAGSAQLTVLDVTGKVLMSRSVEGVAGYNQVTINKGDINVSGVLYYTLENGDFTATKKMIIIE